MAETTLGRAKSMTPEEVLSYLKAQGFVAKERRIRRKKPRKGEFDAWARRLPRRAIVFYGDDSKLSDRSVAFTILHEEGHLTRTMNSSFFKVYLVLLWSPLITLFGWGLLNRQNSLTEVSIAAMAVLAIFSLASPRLFREPLMADEVAADTYAAECMVRIAPELSEAKIAGIFAEVLGPKRKQCVVKRFFIFLGHDVHPPVEERVKTVHDVMVRLLSVPPS